ncbi:plasmid mobilization relaxosome protein MobC [Butyrivibrio sp. INlla16]|uniref:plasmid mobilization protein n=1 Tax=Butyrivibrio sp. INlla16 TaxID=1520807 RepID=UPI00241E1A21|nr:plasmid mobilization relaxosome protein MobC [Butyrivibrio sp. INlla16]
MYERSMISMSKAKRRRNKAITIRMNDFEYDGLQEKIKESGLTQQSFIISAIRDSNIASAKELEVIKDISRNFADQDRQLRGIATNINQMAHVANGQGLLPTVEKMDEIADMILEFRKEDDNRWRLIRQSVSPLKATGA